MYDSRKRLLVVICAASFFRAALPSLALTALLSVDVLATESAPTPMANPLLTESPIYKGNRS